LTRRKPRPALAREMPPVPSACCVPSKQRLTHLALSIQSSAARFRAAAGSLDNMVLLEGARFHMGSEASEAFPTDGEGPVRQVALGASTSRSSRSPMSSSPHSRAKPATVPKPSALAGRSYFVTTSWGRRRRFWGMSCPARPGGCAWMVRLDQQPYRGVIHLVPLHVHLTVWCSSGR
jgi:hypothetical protein